MINQSFQETNKFCISSRVQWIIVVACITMIFTACSKTDNYNGDQVSDYMPLKKGKYWIYLLDSTNFYNSKKVVTQYQVKDVVDDQLTDNLNRATFRLIRYIRPLASIDASDWRKSGQYYMTLSDQVLETTDFFNFKYKSLVRPFILDSSWKGNCYLPEKPYSGALPNSIYPITIDEQMKYWKYAYTGIGENEIINDKSYDNVITVMQTDDTLNLLPDRQTVRDPEGFAWRAFSEEKYAKNIGLVYKKFDLWEYQSEGGYYVGFGIQLQLIDHN